MIAEEVKEHCLDVGISLCLPPDPGRYEQHAQVWYSAVCWNVNYSPRCKQNNRITRKVRRDVRLVDMTTAATAQIVVAHNSESFVERLYRWFTTYGLKKKIFAMFDINFLTIFRYWPTLNFQLQYQPIPTNVVAELTHSATTNVVRYSRAILLAASIATTKPIACCCAVLQWWHHQA